MYPFLVKILSKVFQKSTIFEILFNYSPMYSRSTGQIYFVSPDLHTIKIRIKRSYKNKNYAGSIFGGSLFSATDPIFMIQLIQILGNQYVVWDKSATIKFKRPAYETAYATFDFSLEEIEQLKKQVNEQKELTFDKIVQLTNKDQKTVFAEISKTIYIATKVYYKEKRKQKA